MTKPIYELSMDVICSFSDLPEATCSHCRGDDDDPAHMHGVIDADVERVSPIFAAQYSGVCVLDRSHIVKRGDKVSKVRYVDNPLITLSGVACKNCTLDVPRAK